MFTMSLCTSFSLSFLQWLHYVALLFVYATQAFTQSLATPDSAPLKEVCLVSTDFVQHFRIVLRALGARFEDAGNIDP